MRSGALLLTIAVLVGAPVIAQTVSEKPDWSQQVGPDGSPEIRLLLAGKEGGELLEKLTLVHLLVFDGVQYRSRLLISELESRLIPRAGHTYKWLTPAGRTIILNAKATGKSARDWRMIIDEVAGEIAIVGGDQEVFIYRQSRLVEYEKRGRSYRVEYRDGAGGIVGPRNKRLVEWSEDACGAVKIDAFGRKLDLMQDENRELQKCSGGFPGDLEFGYERRLLKRFRRRGTDAWFEWGQIKTMRYEKSEKVLPPVVINDGKYEFSYAERPGALLGEVFDHGRRLAEWSYGYETGRVTYTHADSR